MQKLMNEPRSEPQASIGTPAMTGLGFGTPAMFDWWAALEHRLGNCFRLFLPPSHLVGIHLVAMSEGVEVPLELAVG